MTIHLDHNATTPVAPGVLEAMRPYLERRLGVRVTVVPVDAHGVDLLARAPRIAAVALAAAAAVEGVPA